MKHISEHIKLQTGRFPATSSTLLYSASFHLNAYNSVNSDLCDIPAEIIQKQLKEHIYNILFDPIQKELLEIRSMLIQGLQSSNANRVTEGIFRISQVISDMEGRGA